MSEMKPRYIRIPGTGETCPHFGLGAATYRSLIANGRIRSIILKQKRGAQRGVRLIDYESVATYLDNAPTQNETYYEQAI